MRIAPALATSDRNNPLARGLLVLQMMSKTPKYRRWVLLLTLGLSSGIAMAQSVAAPGGGDQEFQEIPALENLARAAAAHELAPLTDRQRFLIGPIQPGLELKRCASPVRSVIGQALHMKDRVTVELRCTGPTAWHLYVPVRVIGTTPVAVAAHAIVTGSVLTANDLRVEQHDMSELPQGFFDDPAIAVGLTAARPISGGAIITNQQLVASKAVQHGQAVTLIADTGGMQVRMAGRALSDGLLNQRVRVQNLSSGKIVEGSHGPHRSLKLFFNSPSVNQITVDNRFHRVETHATVKVHAGSDDNRVRMMIVRGEFR